MTATAPSGLRQRLAFPLLCLAAFAEFTGVGITIPALPRFVSDDLGLGDLAVGIAVGFSP